MILHREYGFIFDLQAAIGLIKEADVRFLDMIGQGVAFDGPAMVHGDDLDGAGAEVFDRVVSAVMSLVHFFGLRAESEREHLMSEADAEEGDIGADDFLDDGQGVSVGGGVGVAGSVGEEHAIGFKREDVVSR